MELIYNCFGWTMTVFAITLVLVLLAMADSDGRGSNTNRSRDARDGLRDKSKHRQGGSNSHGRSGKTYRVNRYGEIFEDDD